jgi:hypothetical protein
LSPNVRCRRRRGGGCLSCGWLSNHIAERRAYPVVVAISLSSALFVKWKPYDSEGSFVRSTHALFENPMPIPCSLFQKQGHTRPFFSTNHPIILASTTFCLSCYNEQRVLLLHKEEKRHVWSGWTGSSFFTPGDIRTDQGGSFYVRQCARIGRLFVPGTTSQATIEHLCAKFKGGRCLQRGTFQIRLCFCC